MKIKLVLLVFTIAAITAFVQPGDKIRGVNIGGWLVLEPWIRPSLFKQFEDVPREQKAVDETQFNQRLGKEEAQRQLFKHYEEWYSEEDFKQIKEAGLNLVRIPYGWWILGDSDQFVSGLSYLDKAIQWANKYELSVLLDLHGVPASQNGYDNSGLQCASIVLDKDCASPCPKDPLWPRNVKDMEYAISVLTRIAIRYKDQPSIWGTELLNEPIARIPADDIRQYYTMAYQALSKIVPHWKIVMHDNYRSYNWSDFMQDKSIYPQAILDTHLYLCFENEFLVIKDEKLMFNKSCSYQYQVDYMHNKELPTIVGEFSLAVDDCALHLNGFQQHTRKQDYLGLQCNEPRSQEFWVKLSKSYLYSVERGSGWIFWTWKNELEEDTEQVWSYRKARENGWFPQDARDSAEFIKGSCQNL